MMTQHSRPTAAPHRACGPRGLRSSLAALGATALLVASGCSAGGGGLAGPSDELFADPTKSGSSNPGPGGAVVAELALDAPTRSSFVLHGTVPVPPGTFPRPDGKIPFSIRNADGNVVPTQVEVVSRYPDDADGADVLEVIGRVDLPAGVQAGQRVSYQVVDDPHPIGPLPIDQQLVKFLLTPGNVLLEAEDVFGNSYQVDLFENLRGYKKTKLSRLLRRGQAAVQLRTYNVMTPAAGVAKGAPSGALSHLFGVHSYITLWDNTHAVSLDVRVHNGFDGGDKSTSLDDPLGQVYFKSLELVLPHGWTAMLDVNDPVVGDAYKTSSAVRLPLIAANGDGTMHVMPHQSQFHRRLALARTGDEALALHLA